MVRSPNERLEGFDGNASAEFNQCIEDINMQEMITKGFWYTWSNKRGGNGANKSRLDRVLINDMLGWTCSGTLKLWGMPLEFLIIVLWS